MVSIPFYSLDHLNKYFRSIVENVRENAVSFPDCKRNNHYQNQFHITLQYHCHILNQKYSLHDAAFYTVKVNALFARPAQITVAFKCFKDTMSNEKLF